MAKNVTFAFKPADHVKVAVEDNAVVIRYNTGLVAYSSDEFTGAEVGSNASKPTVDAPKPSTTSTVGMSEMEQLIRGWTGKVDEQGRMVFKDGSVTQPEPNDPLPADFGDGSIDDQVGVLLNWQASHSWYGNQIVIDGQKHGQPGREPSVRFTTKDGKLRVEPGTVNPLVAPSITVPTEPGKGVALDLAWPTKDGQVRPRTGNLGTEPFTVTVRVPADVKIKADQLGFVHWTEVPGGDVTARDSGAWVNDMLVYEDKGNTGPGFNFTVGNPDGYKALGAQFNLQPGDELTARCRTSAGYTGQNSALLCDFSIPSRY